MGRMGFPQTDPAGGHGNDPAEQVSAPPGWVGALTLAGQPFVDSHGNLASRPASRSGIMRNA